MCNSTQNRETDLQSAQIEPKIDLHEVTLTISHQDKRHPDNKFENPFINAKLVFIPEKPDLNQLHSKSSNVIDFLGDSHSEKYFDLFNQSSSSEKDLKYVPELIAGADGSLRDTNLNFTLKGFLKDRKQLKEGNFILIMKSNNPEVQFNLSTYSRHTSRILEIYDSRKYILDTALHQSYLRKIHEEVQKGNLSLMADQNIQYGLKAFNSGFGFGIWKNSSQEYLNLKMKFLGSGIEPVYPHEVTFNRKNFTRQQLLQKYNESITVKFKGEIRPGQYKVAVFETRSRSINASLNYKIQKS